MDVDWAQGRQGYRIWVSVRTISTSTRNIEALETGK
jgi:hypothetical protein